MPAFLCTCRVICLVYNDELCLVTMEWTSYNLVAWSCSKYHAHRDSAVIMCHLSSRISLSAATRMSDVGSHRSKVHISDIEKSVWSTTTSLLRPEIVRRQKNGLWTLLSCLAVACPKPNHVFGEYIYPGVPPRACHSRRGTHTEPNPPSLVLSDMTAVRR